VRREDPLGFGLEEVGILDPGRGERLDDEPVEARIGRLIDRGAPVGALEVDDVHRVQRRELGDEGLVPVAPRVELEARARGELEQAPDRAERGRVGKPERDDEAHRARLPPEGLRERAPSPAQGEVERGALERPAAVEPPLGKAGRAPREEVDRADELREGAERVRAREIVARARLLEGELLLPAVRDVLAHSLLAAPV